MRKNVKQQLALRVLSTAALMAMVSSVATAAFAGTYYLEDGDITVNVKDDGHYVTQGESYNNTRDNDDQVNITSRDKETQEVKTTQNVVTVTVEDNATANVTIEDAKIESKGAKDGSEYKNGITVETKGENAKANITLDNVNVETRKNPEGTKDTDKEGGAAMSVKGNGSTTVELDGSNTLAGGSSGLAKNDKSCTGSLTITDEKNDDGSDKTGQPTDTTGSLIATGQCSGIGATFGNDTSNITISGGHIEAYGTGSTAAGIGGSGGKSSTWETDRIDTGNCSNIHITGNADVTAIGQQGAGIGGGGGIMYYNSNNASNITIDGNATVYAENDRYGAGIGGGAGGAGTGIRIAGNATVVAKGTTGIGSGSAVATGMGYAVSGGNAEVTIGTEGKTKEEEHVTVTAIGVDDHIGLSPVGIGAGCSENDSPSTCTVTIQGGATVKEASGIIGIGGFGNCKSNITIRDDAVIEKVRGELEHNQGNPYPTAIGTSGYYYDGTVIPSTNITISGNAVLKDVSSNGKRIMGCDTGSTVTITGNTQITLNQNDADQYFIQVGTGEDDAQEKSADELMGTIGDDAHIFYNRADGSVYQIVHGKNVCIPDEKGFIVDQEPTCTEEGYGHFTCGYEAANNAEHTSCTRDHSRVAIDPLGHDLKDDWYVVTPATTTSEGLEQRDCHRDGCTYSETRVIPKLTPEGSGSVETREVGVIFWDAAAQAAPAALQGKVLSADEQTTTAAKAQVESLLADKANWKLAEDVGDLKIHPAADAAGTVYEQAVKASGCQYYVIANVTAQ